MKSRVVLLLFCLAGFVLARAGDIPGDDIGKKDDVVGIVIHTDSKKPLKDVSVTAYLSSKKEKLTLTEDDGSFSFDDLKPGKYKFIFEKSGYKKVTKEKIIVNADDAYELDVEMIELNDFNITPSPLHFPDYR